MIKKIYLSCLSIMVLELIGFSSGKITAPNLGWYSTLIKSTLTPPDKVFPIAWSILYFFLALIGSYLWFNRQHPILNKILKYFTIQLVLNLVWTPIFFGLHYTFLGLLILVIIIIETLYIIFLSIDNNKFLAFSLIPYLLWLLFAAYLNLIIVIYN